MFIKIHPRSSISLITLNPKHTIFYFLNSYHSLASNKAATRRASLPSLIIPQILCEDSRKVWSNVTIFVSTSHGYHDIIWNLLFHYSMHILISLNIFFSVCFLSYFYLKVLNQFSFKIALCISGGWWSYTEWLTITVKILLVNLYNWVYSMFLSLFFSHSSSDIQYYLSLRWLYILLLFYDIYLKLICSFRMIRMDLIAQCQLLLLHHSPNGQCAYYQIIRFLQSPS